jgi:hypothetical protein
MFFHIFLIILFLIIFLLATIGYGKFLNILLFNNIGKSNYGECGLLGFVFISFLSTFIHFFYKIDENVNSIIYLFGLFLAFNYFEEIKLFIRKNKILILILCIIAFFMIIYHKPNEDFGYYHLPYLINFISDKVIFGLASIQTNQGWNSMWLNLTATHNLPIIGMNGIHLTNVVFFIFFSLAILDPIINFRHNIKKNYINFLIVFFCLTFFLYFILKYSRLGKYGFDVPSNFIAIYCFYLFLDFFSFKNESINIKNNIFQKIIIFSVFSVLIKLSNLLILLIPAFIFFKNNIKIFSKTFTFTFFFVLVWAIQQFVYTGCFIFPLILSCFDVSWFNLNPVLDLLNNTKGINKSFAQYDGNLSELEYSRNYNWVSTWFGRTKIEMIEHLSTFVIIFSILIIFFYKKKKITYKINTTNNIFYTILFIIFFQIFFWFHASPVVRFGFHYVLLFLFFVLILIFKNLVIKKKNYINFIFIIYISLSINLQKNLFRIYYDIKNGNTFFYSYPKVFFKNEYISDENININYLIKDKSIYCWDTPSLCLAGEQNLLINRINSYLVIIKN